MPEGDKNKILNFSDGNWVCGNAIGWLGEVTIRLVCAIIFAISAFAIKPFLRYVEVHDWPKYNSPHADPESISPAVLFVMCVIAPIVSVCLVTLAGWGTCYPGMWKTTYSNKSMVKRRIATEWLLVALSVTLAYFLTGVITDVTKNLYGRPRPDFLSRCFTPPDEKYRTAYGPNLWLTIPSREHLGAITPLQQAALDQYGTAVQGRPAFPYIEDIKSIIDTEDCINQDEEFLFKGGRRSFPSGHSSFAFASATWCALYWYYWLGRIRTNLNVGRPNINFPGYSIRVTIFFMCYTPAIYVGISRTTDYRHHPGDVIAGALVGITMTFFSFVQYFDLTTFRVNQRLSKLNLTDHSKVQNFDPEQHLVRLPTDASTVMDQSGGEQSQKQNAQVNLLPTNTLNDSQVTTQLNESINISNEIIDVSDQMSGRTKQDSRTPSGRSQYDNREDEGEMSENDEPNKKHETAHDQL